MSLVFSRCFASPSELICDRCRCRVARPGYAAAPGVPTMGEHITAHRDAA